MKLNPCPHFPIFKKVINFENDTIPLKCYFCWVYLQIIVTTRIRRNRLYLVCEKTVCTVSLLIKLLSAKIGKRED